MKNSTKGLIGFLIFLGLIMIIGSLYLFNDSIKTIDQGEFLVQLAEKNNVAEVYIENDMMYVLYRDTKISADDFPDRADAKLTIRDNIMTEVITQYNLDMVAKGQSELVVRVTHNDRNEFTIWTLIGSSWPFLLAIVMVIFLLRAMNASNRQAMSVGKSSAQQSQHTKVKFGDVAGAEEEKDELKEIVEFLKNPAKFSAVGARIPKGVLLVGPPGTGKTLFAKAIAGEANVPFFSISGSDFVEMFVGVGASRVRDLFDQAKRSMPSIIFIDEIDAVGRQRGAGLGGGHDEREQTLNQLLVQMDGFATNEGIIVVAATNRVDILDPALLRPGRFDRQIYVHMPDVRGREAILRVHSRNKPLSPEVDYQTLARMTSGFSGADIENLLNEAAILCARDNRRVIEMRDINEGINKVLLGPQKRSRLITEVDKRITAYHEAGHAIVARTLPECDPVHEISIIPRGFAAGYTMMRPDNDDDHMTLARLTANLAMSMGGRAAEQLVIEDISTGAMGDIKQATQTARRMVTEWGMSSELGPVYYGTSGEVFVGRDYQHSNNNSEQISAKIDSEVSRIIDTAYQTALRILGEKREVMDRMARLLIEFETLYSPEVDMLIAGASLDEVRQAITAKRAPTEA